MISGDRVEYAVHSVSAQDDGSVVPIDSEQWAAATVIDVVEHPVPISAADAVPDVVVRLAPDSGEPPLHLNVKLVRPAG